MDIIYYKALKNNIYIKLEDTSEMPEIILKTTGTGLYSLILYDPDAIGGNKIHWMRVNIKNNKIESGIDIIPYKGPNPPIDTGIHHYIFELYNQDKMFDIKKLRKRFIPMDKLRNKYDLGKPLYTMKFRSKNTKDK